MFSKDPVRNSKDKTLVEATIVGIYKGKTNGTKIKLPL